MATFTNISDTPIFIIARIYTVLTIDKSSGSVTGQTFSINITLWISLFIYVWNIVAKPTTGGTRIVTRFTLINYQQIFITAGCTFTFSWSSAISAATIAIAAWLRVRYYISTPMRNHAIACFSFTLTTWKMARVADSIWCEVIFSWKASFTGWYDYQKYCEA